MNAANNGFRNPKAARPTPMLSTTRVPTKFCIIVRRHRLAIKRVSTSLERSLPMSTTLALSRATSVPVPIAIPAVAFMRAGASLTPSPTIATLRRAVMSALTNGSLSSGRGSEGISSTPNCLPTPSATALAAPVYGELLFAQSRVCPRDAKPECSSM